jgi:hypothetical protein
MKKAKDPSEDEMRPEYRREDLGDGVRGKYHEAYGEGVSLTVGDSKTDVRVDSVRLMREIRAEISGEIKDMDYEKESRYIQERLKNQELPVKEKKR